MRIVIVLLAFMCSCSKSVKVEYVLASRNPAEAHLSGNTFAHMVGEELKKRYPSKVLHPTVTISKERNLFVFHWTCDLVSTSKINAHYHFDRRGTFLSAATKEEVLRSVKRELTESGKVQQMIVGFEKRYGNHMMPEQYVTTTFMQDGNKYWCLNEFFCVAKK